VPELIWEGKYDAKGRKVAPLRVNLPFQTVETINESAQDRQRSLDLFSSGRDPESVLAGPTLKSVPECRSRHENDCRAPGLAAELLRDQTSRGGSRGGHESSSWRAMGYRTHS